MPISAAGSDGASRRGFTSARRSVEHGFTPVERSAEHGFTLVELMVVLVVIAVASAAVVWALPGQRGKLTDEAERFASRAKAAHDLAIVSSQPVSVWLTAGGYGFEQRSHGSWTALADGPLRVERWNDGTAATLDPAHPRERVTFDSTGLADRPYDVRLTRGEAAKTVRIGVDGSVKVIG